MEYLRCAMKRAVLIADDHPLFRDALKLAVLQAVPGAQIIEADSVHSLFAALDTHPDPELLLLDLNMPGAQGFNALVQARAHFPTVPIVVISAREDRRIMHRALGHGAAAFVPKSASIDSSSPRYELCSAATRGCRLLRPWKRRRCMHRWISTKSTRLRDSPTLTPQQFRVLSMLSAGLLNKQIAGRAGRFGSDHQSARQRGDAETRRQQSDPSGAAGAATRRWIKSLPTRRVLKHAPGHRANAGPAPRSMLARLPGAAACAKPENPMRSARCAKAAVPSAVTNAPARSRAGSRETSSSSKSKPSGSPPR